MKMAQEVPNGNVVDVEKMRFLGPISDGEMRAELKQVPPIILEGSRRIMSLKLQIVEEQLDGVEHCPPSISVR